MKTRQLIKALGGALVAAVLVFSAPASADTQLIHFDDATNGWKWYSDVDNNFLFDPTNLQGSVLCADDTDPPGNGSCLIEGGQGVVTTMTRPESGPTSQGHANKDPDASGTRPFTLDSFYFLLTGNGTGADNSITATGSNGVACTFYLGATADFCVDGAGALTATDAVVTNYLDGTLLVGGLLKGTPGQDQGRYVASFGDLFAGVSFIGFTAADDAQLRLDCIVATSTTLSTTEPLSGFTGGCGGGEPPTNNVPEPGTLALLGLGLVGMGLTRRRRKV